MKRLAAPLAMLLFFATAVVAHVGIVAQRGKAGMENQIYRRQADEVSRSEYVASFGMYLPQGDFPVAAASFLGGVGADMYWLKAAQYVGKAFEDPALKRRFLGDLYLAMIKVDPYWSSAACTAANAISAVSGNNEKAIRVLDAALRARPGNWRLWYAKMAVYLFWPGHIEDATRMALAGARMPGASNALRDAANSLAVEHGNYQLAVKIAEDRIALYGIRSSMGALAFSDYLEHLARLEQVNLGGAVKKFHETNGRFPADLAELAKSGVDVPAEPYGLGWVYKPQTGVVLSTGLNIIEGVRMASLLGRFAVSYSNKYGHMPESLDKVEPLLRQVKGDPEIKRLFGEPAEFRPHPLLGDWPYSPQNGIQLPEQYQVQYIKDVTSAIRGEVIKSMGNN